MSALLAAFVGTPDVNRVYNVDALTLLRNMADQSANCIVTSPPYFALRDYGVPGQIGLEETPQAYVAKLVELFREARRVLRDDGTFWLNLGDSYVTSSKGSGGASDKQLSNAGSRYEMSQRLDYGLPDKSLLGIPWRVAFALQDDGWILRSDIIWNKPNPMPESVTDRPTKAHEYVFLFAKSQRYWYDADAIKEPLAQNSDVAYRAKLRQGKQYNAKEPYMNNFPASFDLEGRNKRSVWTIPTQPNTFAHFATFPMKLIEPMILAGCPVGGLVLDPFMGSGTTALVARANGRDYIGSELNPEYVAIANQRLNAPHTPSFLPALEALDASA